MKPYELTLQEYLETQPKRTIVSRMKARQRWISSICAALINQVPVDSAIRNEYLDECEFENDCEISYEIDNGR